MRPVVETHDGSMKNRSSSRRWAPRLGMRDDLDVLGHRFPPSSDTPLFGAGSLPLAAHASAGKAQSLRADAGENVGAVTTKL
jgi:hypothetical protein